MASQRALVIRNGVHSQILDADTLLSGSGIDTAIAQPIAIAATTATAVNIARPGVLTTISGPSAYTGTATFNGASVFNGSVTQNGPGAFTFSGNGPSSFDSTSTLTIGGTNATAVNIGRAAGTLGFFGAAPIVKPSIIGSPGDPEAVQSLAATLSSLGLATNSTAFTTPAVTTVMHIGDSFTTGSNVAPGGMRTNFYKQLLSTRNDTKALGPVVAAHAAATFAYADMPEILCAGYPGFKVEDITALCGGAATGPAPAPLIAQNMAAFGVPKIIYLMIGVNNFYAGESAASVRTKYNTLIAQIQTIAPPPNTHIVNCKLPHVFTPATPTGGIAAYNTNIDTFNANLSADSGSGNLYGASSSAIDTSQLQLGDITPADGLHPTFSGQSKIGQVEAVEFERLRPRRSGQWIPRPFRMRPKQASPLLVTQATDAMTVTDNGFRNPAGSFIADITIRPTALVGAGILNIVESTPTNYSRGWALLYDASTLDLSFYVMNFAPQVTFRNSPFVINSLVRIWCCADFANGIVSMWMATQQNPQAQWTFGCLGMARNVPAWAIGDINPILTVGKHPSFAGGFAGIFNQISFYQGPSVPTYANTRDALAASLYEGQAVCADRTGYLPCDAGAGTVIVSGMGGPSATLSLNSWSPAGTIPTGWDQ